MKIVSVLSGGLDSTTTLYKIKKRHKVEAISFNYGQRHLKELEMARKTCDKLNVSHTIIDISSITQFISNSALTGNIEIPHGHYESDNMKLTVVPSRNTIMAAIANGYAVNLDYDGIALGVHAGDFAIYPDCRPQFIKALKKLFKVNNFKPCKILTPFLKVNKTAIVKEGLKLKVNYSLTWTCYEGRLNPCMRCGACCERTGAFAQNKVKDPLYTDQEWQEAINFAEENGIKI